MVSVTRLGKILLDINEPDQVSMVCRATPTRDVYIVCIIYILHIV